MKKLLTLSIFGYFLLISTNPAKADWDTWAIKTTEKKTLRELINMDPDPPLPAIETNIIEIYQYDSFTGAETLINRFEQGDTSHIGTAENWRFQPVSTDETAVYKPSEGVFEFKSSTQSDKKFIYDINSNSWSTGIYSSPENAASSYQIQFGKKVVVEQVDGSIRIGENSWITKEENGRQKVFAEDANGKPIPIDYTNGTKLLINGKDIEQSINNVGALSAALTGLPTVPKDTNLACGVGTGTHGGDFAFSGGCASKVNDKLSINYAASMTMPGQDYAGDFEDQFSARAGFIWKLGKATKPTQISIKDKKVMETKIESLEKKNKEILSKNQKLEKKLSTLMARLEKIEKIALSESK